MFEDLPPFMTVAQSAQVLQIGRSTAYEMTVEWEESNGESGLPFVWIGRQKRVPRTAIEALADQTTPSSRT